MPPTIIIVAPSSCRATIVINTVYYHFPRRRNMLSSATRHLFADESRHQYGFHDETPPSQHATPTRRMPAS